MRNRLLNLLKNNAGKGVFKAEGNTIYIYDAIVASDEEAEWWGGVSAESFVKTIKDMKGDVQLRINCPGGDVFGARAMAQAIREYDGEVIAHVDGYAASAASFITSVADKTIMAAGSMLMIHKAWSIAIGNSEDFLKESQLLEKIDGTIVETYEASAKRRGLKDMPDFSAMIADETWLNGEEAIAAGLADEVSEEKVKAQSKWDFSAYEHAPVPDVDDDNDEAVVEPEAVEPPAPPEPEPEPVVEANDNVEMEQRRRMAGMLHRPASA